MLCNIKKIECNIKKIEYEYCGIRVLSNIKLHKGKLHKIYWIEIYSYDTNTWDKFKEIAPIPKGAVIKSFYECGNGDLVPPFWERVEEKMEEIRKEFLVLNVYDKFTPGHFIGINACGMNTYVGDELYRILILQKKIFKFKHRI